jgi:hypothetical protein
MYKNNITFYCACLFGYQRIKQNLKQIMFVLGTAGFLLSYLSPLFWDDKTSAVYSSVLSKLSKKRGLIEETVTAKVLSSRNRREKEDRIGESQPFRERTLSHQGVKIKKSSLSTNEHYPYRRSLLDPLCAASIFV